MVHALTASGADAAGDWWQPLIGPGRALDTDRMGVLCANLLGGRYGSTGPTSIEPGRGEPWGSRFPSVTTRDQAAMWALADVLGIERVAMVTGGSLGGMVALEVALERPDRVDRVMPIAAPARPPAPWPWPGTASRPSSSSVWGTRGWPSRDRLAMTTYRSEADLDGRFGRRREADRAVRS
ncbi:MAG: alpha/beta fold hydrolase [Chloroflexota bacterium]